MPRVRPCSVPDWMETRSDSLRGVEMADWPGRRRVSWGWMSASERGRPGRQPSIMQVTEGQCDSPALLVWEGEVSGGSMGKGGVRNLRCHSEVMSEGGHSG